jgi:hypothetical protein
VGEGSLRHFPASLRHTLAAGLEIMMALGQTSATGCFLEVAGSVAVHLGVNWQCIGLCVVPASHAKNSWKP